MANRFEVESIFKGKDKISAPISKMRTRITRFLRSVRTGFKKANKVIGGMTKAIFSLGKKMSLFGAIAIGAVGVMLKKFADAGDELAKFSRRIGIGVEALQQWRFAAGLSGIETESFDKAIGKLAKGIGEARANTGTLVTLLKKSNPELLKQLLTVDKTEDGLLLMVDALRKTSNAQDKAALATAAFGRAGANLINLAENSEEALKGMRLESSKLGLITEAQAKSSEKFNDALLRAKLALTGIRNVIGGALLPVLTPLIDRFKEFAVGLRPKVEAFAKSFAEALPERVEALISGFKQLIPLAKKFFAGIASIDKESLTSLMSDLRGVLSLMKAIGTAVNAIATVFKVIGTGLGNLAGISALAFQGDFSAIAAEAKTKNEGRALKQAPNVVSPSERVSRSIEETKTTNEDRLIIENQTGNNASLQRGRRSRSNVNKTQLINSGGF